MSFLLCTDSVPQFLKYFDLSVAPSLLYYAYIPVIALSLFFGLYIVVKDKFSLRSKFLFAVSSVFVFWVLNIILQWIIVYANISMFSWQITPIIEIFISISVLYFFYIFIYGHNASNVIRYLSYGIVTIVALITPTIWNMRSFDPSLCEASVGPLLYSVNIFEIIVAIWLLFVAFKNILSKKYDADLKNKSLILALGSASFLIIFSLSNIFGQVTQIYSINLFGPIGMILFLGLLTYLIVKYHTFNIKLISAQALVISLVILIGSQFFFIQTNTNRIMTAVTLIITGAIGINLIRSVKKEIESKEKIEKLAQGLEVANVKLKELDQLKSEFLSLATHQIRAPLTAIKGYSSMLVEGDFGVLPQKAKDSADTIMKSCQNLINIVEDFLNISRIEQGRMVYEKSVFDVGELVKEKINEIKPNIQNAGLTLDFDAPENFSAKVNADRGKIRQIIGNIIDNAIKYTPHGNIKVSVFEDAGKVKIAVKDSGIGIDPKDMSKLFVKFSRAKDAHKTNTNGTGLGLYVAKKMAEGHGGDIKVSSEGVGKGSTFTIELPMIKSL
jgi:signal transduction histidine kinase